MRYELGPPSGDWCAARAAAFLRDPFPRAFARPGKGFRPECFGDESFGDHESFKTPAAYAQIPPGSEYSWLRDLRANPPAPLAPGEPLKWCHLKPVLDAAPRGAIALGAARALSTALLVILDLEEMRSREGRQASTNLERWLRDVSITDELVRVDPLVRMARASSADLRAALDVPPPLPPPGDPLSFQRAINGIYLGTDRPERHAHLLPYTMRSTATAVDWIDPATWSRKADEVFRSGHRYMLGERIQAAVVGEVVRPRRSFERGQERSTDAVNALLGAAAPRRDGPLRLWSEMLDDLDDSDDDDPLGSDLSEFAELVLSELEKEAPANNHPADAYVAFPGFIVEHRAADFDEGQAADMAAGWARDVYNEAESPALGIQQLCGMFRGVIHNGRLYQR